MENPRDRATPLDALVVGGGPAGLAAATYLGRFRRSTVVYDAGDARALLIPTSRNCPGFPDGISGTDLLDRMRRQAQAYGAAIRHGRVEALRRAGDLFEAETSDGRILARKIVLATGIEDHPPPLADWRGLVTRGLIRICPVCDAYEVIDRRVGIVGQGGQALREAVFLGHYTARVVLLSMHGSPLGAELRGEAEAAGFPVWDVAALAAHNAGFVARLDGGGERELDFVYAAMGCSARSGLVRSLGIACEDDGSIPTGKRQETGLPGVYAIGDVVEALNQIAVAFGHAALAATHIHNSLRGATEA